jgi:serine/threonine-protein kinase RsbW
MEEIITITNKVEELQVLAERIEQLGDKWDLPMPLTMNLNLVLEEAVSNVIFYAFPDGGTHNIEILVSNDGNELTLKIVDDGIPFDPTSVQQPDVNLPVEERSIGGLGIFLISKIMDHVSYCREQEKNILTATKRL